MRVGVLMVLAWGCAGPPELDLCVRTAPDDSPFTTSATELRLRAIPLEGPEVVRVFSNGTSALRLPRLDFGSYAFALEARRGDDILASGRTPQIEIGEDPSSPCLYFATAGTFGDPPGQVPASAGRFAVTEEGRATALILTDQGFERYDHPSGAITPVEITFTPTTAPVLWVRLPGARAARLTPAGVQVLEAAEVAESLEGPLADLEGAAAIAVGVSRILLVGGAGAADAAPTDLVRVVDLTTLGVEEIDDVRPLRDARVESLGNGRFVVVGGNEGTAAAPIASDLMAIVDPVEGVLFQGRLDTPRRDHSMAVVGGNVLVFGGRGASGQLLSSIEWLRFGGGTLVHAGVPRPMQAARAGAVAVPLGEDVLLVGGQAEGDALTAAERFRFAENGTAPDDPPGVALPDPASVELHDGTVLVVGGGNAVVYRP